MRVGLSLTTEFRGDPAPFVAGVIDQVRTAWDAGLDSIQLGDHHAHPTGYLQNVPLLGRLATEWPGRSAIMLALLPVWPPVLLAEQLGILSALTGAEVSLCAGLGYRTEEFAAFGLERARRVDLFEGHLARLRSLIDIPVLVAAQSAPAVDRAGLLGDGWLAPPGAFGDDLADLLRQWRSSNAGRRGRTVLRRDVHIADAAECDAVRAAVARNGYRGLPAQGLVVGTIDEVAASFADFAAAGFDEILVRPIVDDSAGALRCLRALGKVRELLMTGDPR